MYSTEKNITNNNPSITPDVICNKYFQYPDETAKRQAEGGLRLNGQYKQSFKDKPLITVITVVYNNEKTLERCIKSVLEQTYDNIEYIVIDGGSSDGTLDIIKKYEYAIDYFISEPDGGIYYAMNKGLNLTSGDYIGILNSDDLYRKNAVEVSINRIMADNSDGSVAIANMYNNNGDLLWKFKALPFDDTAYLKRNPCNHQTLFLSKEGYNLIGSFDTNFKFAADLNSEYLMIQNSLNISRIDKVIIDAYFEGGATEKNYSESQKEAYKVASRFTGLSSDEHRIIADYMLASKKPDDSKFFETVLKKTNLSIRQFSALFKKYYSDDVSKMESKTESILASVIIPAFNAEDDISRCLDSVINQTYKNIEIIVVNDASTDNTRSIVEKYIQKDTRVTCIDKVENSGLLQARMTGIEKAKGEYIYSVDSDDYVMLDLVKDTITEALKHNADIVQFPMKFSNNDRRYTNNWTNKKYQEYDKNDFFYHNGNSCTIMFKKELGIALIKCTDSLSVNYHEDYIISIILSAFYKKSRYIDIAYYVYCDTDVSMTRQYSDDALLKYMRDTLIFGKLMNSLMPVIFPKENANYLNAVLLNRIMLMKKQLNFYFKERENVDIHDLYKNTYDNKTFIIYSILNDAIEIKDGQLQTIKEQLKSENNQLKSENNQLKSENKRLQPKIKQLSNNRWYRFGQMSNKRKIWTIGKVVSKKIKIYWLIQPITKQLKKSIGKVSHG